MENKPIYVTMPTLAPREELDKLLDCIWESGIMTHNGPIVQEFEKKVSEYCKVPYMVTATNGTLALQLAIKALELQGEIITTPFTFIATISSIMWEKCIPVFVDIDPESFNIDPKKIEEKITSHTVAIMPVHVFGNSCEIDMIQAIANKHKLKVIYDACHSFGVLYKNKSIFSYGDISVTSFHATKMLNTAEGGGCFTQNKTLDEKMRRIRFFGFERHSDIIEEGFNGKMTEVNAAIGLVNLKCIDAALSDRRHKYLLYKEVLSDNPSLTFQKINENSCNYSYFPVVFPDERVALKIIEKLQECKIYPRRYFYPTTNTFQRLFSYSPMPIAENISSRIMCLPLHIRMNEEQVCYIAETILKYC